MSDAMTLLFILGCFLASLNCADGSCFLRRCLYRGRPGCRGITGFRDTSAYECCDAEGGVGFYNHLEQLGSGCYQCHSCHEILGKVDGGWSDWSRWTDCTRSCGGGLQYQTRSCNSPVPSELGLPCQGQDRVERKCNTQPCPIHGGWTPWSDWSDCSRSCGQGIEERIRSCTNPRPQHEGRSCRGRDRESRPCHKIQFCPIDGGWGAWSDWSPCSKSCGEGRSWRQRECDNPPPQHNGVDCSGDLDDLNFCNTQPCPVHGGWSAWSPPSRCLFSDCSKKEKGGIRLRSRACNNPSPGNGGSMCKGKMFDKYFCVEPENCPVDGGMSAWTSWRCTCFSAMRTRECNNPIPKLGGKNCTEVNREMKKEADDDFCQICPQQCRDARCQGGSGESSGDGDDLGSGFDQEE